MLNKIKEMLGMGEKKKDPRIAAAEAINGLNESSQELKSTVRAYETLCVEAIEKGNESYASELIEIMADMTDFSSELEFFALQIKAEVIMLLSFGNLNKLAGALDSCIKIINSSGNYDNVKSSIASFKNNLGQGRAALAELRGELKKKTTSEKMFSDPRFDSVASESANSETVKQIRDRIETELVKRNMTSGLPPVSATKEEKAKKYADASGGAADIDYIDKIVKEETEQE